jgi:hypothetical protein
VPTSAATNHFCDPNAVVAPVDELGEAALPVPDEPGCDVDVFGAKDPLVGALLDDTKFAWMTCNAAY